MSTLPKVLLAALRVGVLLIGIVAFVMFGPPRYAETINRPAFCRSCHVMEPQYQSYVRGTHRNVVESCNDCHLPNNSFVRHWVADAFVGTRDLVKWNLNLVPAYVEAKPRSQRWIQENCVRCHGELNSHIELAEGVSCWDCHRETQHQIHGRRDKRSRQVIRENE